MNIDHLVDEAIDKIMLSITSTLSDSEESDVRRIIQDKPVKGVALSSKSCTTTVVRCCGPESDLAHKIEHELKTAQNALIANLKSMR